MLRAALLPLCGALLLTGVVVAEEKPKPVPILLDTDIGSHVDDAFALGLALADERVELVGVTTVGEGAEDRAWIVCRLLTHLNRQDIPVAFGRGEQPKGPLDWQIQYRRHPAVVWDRTAKPVKQTAVELMYEKLKTRPGEITIVGIGPLTNVAQLLKEHPDAKSLIKRIVFLGGSLQVGYDGKPPAVAEWTVKQDIEASMKVFHHFAEEVPLVMVPLDAAAGLDLTEEKRRSLFATGTPLASQLHNLWELCETPENALVDSAAVVVAVHEQLAKVRPGRISVGVSGRLSGGILVGGGEPNVQLVTTLDRVGLIDHCFHTLSNHGESAWPAEPKNRSSIVSQGRFPSRVHVFEDYDTDIEKRWWMCGKLETKDVPEGGRRACRAVLTQDFDDRQGDRGVSYRAVIFNPVPGPPMGPSTRLSFRYKLHGTDTLRVQLFSLSNGYHRYLSVSDLPQDEWQSATVDMTQMRRPDGTGGPLSADERIDDIQFYIDPRAELLIDDVILYDAAAEGEQRPFPKRILFTGWFDTGKQGQEWPGEFEIVPHEKPRTWKFARSITDRETGQPKLVVDLRGPRRLAAVTELTFKYRLTGADSLTMELVDREGNHTVDLSEVKTGEWTEATVPFVVKGAESQDRFASAIRFQPPAGGVLEIDDVLLYEPSAGP
ncbi:MAG TPA: nucleoside hydrolase [Pirellulaceae bacterium]|nr:nucleoside hydrolase [Pirellulaceae bacterium]